MTIEEKYVAELIAIQDRSSGDTEGDHGDADDCLVRMLIELGYDKVAKEYERIDKWYS